MITKPNTTGRKIEIAIGVFVYAFLAWGVVMYLIHTT